ncbi:hypothetical protein OXX80_003487 [Metschnikowia pulcherrima]|nr:hypothetical protein OY671_000161 [Metschnikowia pulcherrima]
MTHTMILTGASRGIGASIAEIYLAQSSEHKLVAVARSQAALEQLESQYGDRVKVLVADVSEPETAEKAVGLALEHFGSIDSVVANAGILDPVDSIEKSDVNKWRKLFEINFFSVAQLVQAALPHLKKSHGRVVAVSSGASKNAYYGWAAYGASKAALNHFISTLVEENIDIQAISVAPGVVATSMQKDIREKFGKNMSEESLKKFLDLHKNGDLLPPEIPATVYTNLAVRGWPRELNGRYYRVNDEVLKKYLA